MVEFWRNVGKTDNLIFQGGTGELQQLRPTSKLLREQQDGRRVLRVRLPGERDGPGQSDGWRERLPPPSPPAPQSAPQSAPHPAPSPHSLLPTSPRGPGVQRQHGEVSTPGSSSLPQAAAVQSLRWEVGGGRWDHRERYSKEHGSQIKFSYVDLCYPADTTYINQPLMASKVTFKSYLNSSTINITYCFLIYQYCLRIQS